MATNGSVGPTGAREGPNQLEIGGGSGRDEPLCPAGTGLCGVSLAAVLFLALLVSCLMDSIHKIQEGSVGIYFKQGALLESLTDPGIHYHAPFITRMVEITIRPETYIMDPIRCITKDGIENTFYKISVISSINRSNVVSLIRTYGANIKNTLVYDRINEELRTFCANHSIDEVYNEKFLDVVIYIKRQIEVSITRLGEDGIRILNVVVPKPDIPEDIANNYKMVKVQWTEQLVSIQKQKTEKIKKETEKIKAILDAEKEREVLQINISKEILQKQGEQTLAGIQNNITKSIAENGANIAAYRMEKEAEANEKLYTEKSDFYFWIFMIITVFCVVGAQIYLLFAQVHQAGHGKGPDQQHKTVFLGGKLTNWRSSTENNELKHREINKGN